MVAWVHASSQEGVGVGVGVVAVGMSWSLALQRRLLKLRRLPYQGVPLPQYPCCHHAQGPSWV